MEVDFGRSVEQFWTKNRVEPAWTVELYTHILHDFHPGFPTLFPIHSSPSVFTILTMASYSSLITFILLLLPSLLYIILMVLLLYIIIMC